MKNITVQQALDLHYQGHAVIALPPPHAKQKPKVVKIVEHEHLVYLVNAGWTLTTPLRSIK